MQLVQRSSVNIQPVPRQPLASKPFPRQLAPSRPLKFSKVSHDLFPYSARADCLRIRWGMSHEIWCGRLRVGSIRKEYAKIDEDWDARPRSSAGISAFVARPCSLVILPRINERVDTLCKGKIPVFASRTSVFADIQEQSCRRI